jgi:hypothetical protein
MREVVLSNLAHNRVDEWFTLPAQTTRISLG